MSGVSAAVIFRRNANIRIDFVEGEKILGHPVRAVSDLTSEKYATFTNGSRTRGGSTCNKWFKHNDPVKLLWMPLDKKNLDGTLVHCLKFDVMWIENRTSMRYEKLTDEHLFNRLIQNHSNAHEIIQRCLKCNDMWT